MLTSLPLLLTGRSAFGTSGLTRSWPSTSRLLLTPGEESLRNNSLWVDNSCLPLHCTGVLVELSNLFVTVLNWLHISHWIQTCACHCCHAEPAVPLTLNSLCPSFTSVGVSLSGRILLASSDDSSIHMYSVSSILQLSSSSFTPSTCTVSPSWLREGFNKKYK